MAVSWGERPVPYGATLLQAMGLRLKQECSWLFGIHTPAQLLRSMLGLKKLENIEKGVTVAEQMDDITGLSTLVVIDTKRGLKGKKRPSSSKANR